MQDERVKILQSRYFRGEKHGSVIAHFLYQVWLDPNRAIKLHLEMELWHLEWELLIPHKKSAYLLCLQPHSYTEPLCFCSIRRCIFLAKYARTQSRDFLRTFTTYRITICIKTIHTVAGTLFCISYTFVRCQRTSIKTRTLARDESKMHKESLL